ncbi:hypothetical protein LF1_40990 [Rubripirellula obstinata]|uniref:SLA1 homology domain-containing protein n=1 Tax=Rubripirellula obstinata TaxID=406547 RepID=A0A5B1CNY5_9BACT|nr:SHD1 domain-containing protein [Rubripirellula obstinata]KAA1261549.1 hypothetical protein LF1_40990 [Rubripirellula obstinata]
MIFKPTSVSRFATSAFAVGAFFLIAIPTTATAQQVNRVWVDSSGLHSVDASLVRVTEDQQFVILRRSDGGTVTLMIDQLSLEDREFIDDHLRRDIEGNRLRQRPPEAPEHDPLPVLALSTTVDQDRVSPSLGGQLNLESNNVVRPRRQLPEEAEADCSPWSIGCTDAVISIDEIDFADEVSAPIPIVVTDDWQTRKTSVAVSLSEHTLIPGQATRRQLLRFDFGDQSSIVAMQSKGRVRLLDHHIGSGRSLLLTGHGTMGEGGSIALAEGWNEDNVRQISQQLLPGADSSVGQSPPKLLWANLVDSQHVIAQLKSSIVLWNLVSGETVFRIDHVDPRSEPALSEGGRYLAVPASGAVDLYAVETGKPLGRIKVEPQMPGVSFSPYGNALAIVTSRRLRIWNLVDAALDADISSRESFGQGAPTWIDHDMLLSSNGILASQFRGLPIWKYDLAAAKVTRVGKHVAIVRKEPWSQLVTMQLPHQSAKRILKQLDATSIKVDESDWRIPGRSTWDGGAWVDRSRADRSLRVSRNPSSRR